MKKRYKDILIFITGLVLCAYPVISNMLEYHEQKKMISTYESVSSEYSKQKKEQILSDAKSYNEKLYLAQKGVSAYDASSYDDMLNISDGVMGSLEIPSIDVNLPIYHGTSQEVLSVGVGHLQDTSLPIGGQNTHCVLTGHRGLPSSKLFTRLDEMEKEDMFFIHVLDKINAYKIDDIKVIDPEEVDGFEIEDGKDRATLITCTPYGINTQRLIVSGIRVKYTPQSKKAIKKKMMSIREIIFFMIPVAFIILGAVRFRKGGKKCRNS